MNGGLQINVCKFVHVVSVFDGIHYDDPLWAYTDIDIGRYR